MRLSGRALILLTAVTAVLAGCATDGAKDRPRPKPEALVVNFVQPLSEKPGKAKLSRARISTKSGDIQILEPDGTITEMELDEGGIDAFAAVSEADLMMLNDNLNLNFAGRRDLGPVAKKPTAQELALANFRARTQPLFPNLKKDFSASPEMFKGVQIEGLKDSKGRSRDMVKVNATLKRGVDADTAFAYATCALADWAKANGKHYARHIMTDQAKRNGELQVGAYFTLSNEQPMGLKVMKSDETLQICKDRGIPAT